MADDTDEIVLTEKPPEGAKVETDQPTRTASPGTSPKLQPTQRQSRRLDRAPADDAQRMVDEARRLAEAKDAENARLRGQLATTAQERDQARARVKAL